MNVTESVTVIDPAAEDSSVSLVLAQRLASLAGARLGFIDNSKHMASELLDAVQELLQRRYQVKSFKRYRKSNPSIPTPSNALTEFIGSCDAIVHGVAD